MGGICGWFGNTGIAAPPDVLLEDMARALPQGPLFRHSGRAEPTSAIAAKSWPGQYDVEDTGGLMAAIEGNPRWADMALESLAHDKGHAAALAEAYRSRGRDALQVLSGPFSLALLDRNRNAALLAIDRLGIHSLCYARNGAGGLVFGASTDAVLAHPAIESTVSDQAVFNYLYSFVSSSPGTIYREQRKLLPAQYLWFENGEIEDGFYWQVPYRTDGPSRLEPLAAELKDLLGQATDRAIEGSAGGEAGSFLSGGLDSSTVAGLLKEAKGTAKTFTIGFGDRDYDESRYAHIASEHFGTEQHDLVLTPEDVLAFLPRLAEAYDEPFGNSSAIPAFYCARLARENGVDLMLAGDGGDEIFAGNSQYTLALLFESYLGLPRILRKGLIEPAIGSVPAGERIRLVRRARNFLKYANTPLPDRLDVHNFYLSTDLSDLFETGVLAGIDPDEPRRLRREVYHRARSESPLQRMLHADLKTALADNDLRKVTRMCDLAGVQVRFPFLDEDLVAFSARVPPSLMMRRWTLRYFYKEAMRDYLPREIIEKEKHGFGMPFAEWTQSHPGLRDLARDSLTQFKTRGYLKAAFLDRMIESHGAEDPTALDGLVWDVMMLELWFESRRGRSESKARALVF